MRIRLLLIAVFLIFVFAAGIFWIRDRYGHVDPRAIYAESERADLIDNANKGDVRASFRLYLYYSFVDYSPEQMEKWLMVGAKQDDVRSIHALSFFYVSDNAPEKDFEKAEHWADILAQHDAEQAKKMRREIERVRQKIVGKRP